MTSELTGDMKGTVLLAMDGDRMVRRSSDSLRMMGKTSHTETWNLSTPDSTWTADLTKKTGTAAPNLLPFLASAYDKLNGDEKKRFHQNMADMASMISRGFNLGQINSGEKLGKRSYAGHECEERQFGSFTVCQMENVPIVLHTSGNLVCINYAETATSVKLGSAARDLFTPPPGVTFQPAPGRQKPDSAANGFVGYLASKALSDSLGKAKAELEAAKAKQTQAGQPDKMTPEQQAQMQQACDMIKNFDMDRVLAGAADAWKKALVDAAKNEAKNQAINKLKGLFKRP